MVGTLLFTALGACEPPRILSPDSGPVVDTGVEMDSGVVMDSGIDTGVSRPDARPEGGLDATMCDPDRCFDDCVAMGGVTGRCMSNMCSCRFPDSGSMGTDATSDRRDVPSESSIRGCMTNDQCPPSMFCSAPSCTGPGSCLLRQERDPNLCVDDPMPSCGCDGLLYPSACARSTLGVRQDAMRRCMGDAAVIPPTDARTGGG